jgi:hypothetical protein
MAENSSSAQPGCPRIADSPCVMYAYARRVVDEYARYVSVRMLDVFAAMLMLGCIRARMGALCVRCACTVVAREISLLSTLAAGGDFEVR